MKFFLSSVALAATATALIISAGGIQWGTEQAGMLVGIVVFALLFINGCRLIDRSMKEAERERYKGW